ncbi:kynurenine 3-monooxygenase [Luteibacter rhizovicinus]|uniref:Kynurenine 3-monooxygenase n=1 Tax=Luteibacter rhizovicinus TaxID=242606 RepID=A0A4R3YY75_9GAMM|nr:NAD(P)/FAD-dependent oxidoreductase [Luteibacter rhizovicinus]TCV97546.1 kynurenine 3-monooxygenase [Luteibacter rhizovicinus]
MARKDIVVVGAGLVGSLIATLLSQRGFRVTVFEKRPDPRRAGFQGGRSINLALAERGLHALRATGLAEDVLAQAVMMRGRMVHDRDGGGSNLQRYGVDDSEVIWSVSRGGLNTLMLDAAEAAGATVHFDQGLADADFDAGHIVLRDDAGNERRVDAATIIGADGAGSALRTAMHAHTPLGERVEELGHGYKELEIPPGADASQPFAIERHALHIWPRGGYMCIALPNREGSFTVTLFLPNAGAYPSFATLPDIAAAETLFRTEFPDALALMPDFAADYAAHPVGMLATLYLDRWHIGGKALLIGDAAHAIVPFHGQGMNCGFEDAAELADLFAAQPDDPADVYAEFQRRRKPNADAIAAMALENYIEMRDSVADPHYLRKRALGGLLAERAPEHYMPRYRMVTFTHLPYLYALERGRAQDMLVEQLLKGHDDVAGVNLDAAVTTLRATLPPLPKL